MLARRLPGIVLLVLSLVLAPPIAARSAAEKKGGPSLQLHKNLPKDPLLVLGMWLDESRGDIGGMIDALDRFMPGDRSKATPLAGVDRELAEMLRIDLLPLVGPEVVLSVDFPPIDEAVAALQFSQREAMATFLARVGLVARVRDTARFDRKFQRLIVAAGGEIVDTGGMVEAALPVGFVAGRRLGAPAAAPEFLLCHPGRPLRDGLRRGVGRGRARAATQGRAADRRRGLPAGLRPPGREAPPTWPTSTFPSCAASSTSRRSCAWCCRATPSSAIFVHRFLHRRDHERGCGLHLRPAGGRRAHGELRSAVDVGGRGVERFHRGARRSEPAVGNRSREDPAHGDGHPGHRAGVRRILFGLRQLSGAHRGLGAGGTHRHLPRAGLHRAPAAHRRLGEPHPLLVRRRFVPHRQHRPRRAHRSDWTGRVDPAGVGRSRRRHRLRRRQAAGLAVGLELERTDNATITSPHALAAASNTSGSRRTW